MSTARQLSDSELNKIKSEMEELNEKVQTEEISYAEGHEVLSNIVKNLSETYDASNVSELRVKVWIEAREKLTMFGKNKRFEEREAGYKFPAGTILASDDLKRVTEVKEVILRTKMDGFINLSDEEVRYANTGVDRSKQVTRVPQERYARLRIGMLGNFGTGIAPDHKEIQNLWKMYNKKIVANYLAYAKSMKRTDKRDSDIREKLKGLFNKDPSIPQIQAALNLLEPKFPESKGSEE